MSTTFLARAQMGLSLSFHIVFACIGIAMPLLMAIAEWRWLRTRDEQYLTLAKLWSKGTAIFFAVGAVSGTVLSFELGLLFPQFMEQAGAIVGLPFALEGFAFFTEAIFLGIYLYAWDRVSPRMHLASGILVAASGLASAAFVTTVNAWMNAPAGFAREGDKLVALRPFAAFESPFVAHEILHMAVAAYLSVALGVAAIHAFALLRAPNHGLHIKAFRLAMWLAAPMALVQPVIGHFAGQQVARHQPMKLAAMEGHFDTQPYAPLHLGGIADYEEGRVKGGIPIPGLLSFLATNSFSAVIPGLKEFPREDWPPPGTRYAFQIMVGLGTLFALLGLWWFLQAARGRPWSRRFLKAAVAAGPMGMIAVEAGWYATELGRQPWVIYGVQRTAEGATRVEGLEFTFLMYTVIFLTLAYVVFRLMRAYVRLSFAQGEGGTS